MCYWAIYFNPNRANDLCCKPCQTFTIAICWTWIYFMNVIQSWFLKKYYYKFSSRIYYISLYIFFKNLMKKVVKLFSFILKFLFLNFRWELKITETQLLAPRRIKVVLLLMYVFLAKIYLITKIYIYNNYNTIYNIYNNYISLYTWLN